MTNLVYVSEFVCGFLVSFYWENLLDLIRVGRKKVMAKIAITGGKEETPMVEFVTSNYHGKNPWEKLVIIEGACSSDTLRHIAKMLDEENNEAFIRFQNNS